MSKQKCTIFIWKLSEDLNIYSCHHVYEKANKTTDCLTKRGLGITSTTWWSNFCKMLQILVWKITVDHLLIVFVFAFVRLRHCSFPLSQKEKLYHTFQKDMGG